MADVSMRLRLTRSRAGEAAERLAKEAGERLQAQVEAAVSAIADLQRQRAELEARYRGDELAEQLDDLRDEGAEVARQQEAAVEAARAEHEAFKARAPWLRPTGTGGFSHQPPEVDDPDAAGETRRFLLFATKAERAAMLLEAAAAYYTDREQEQVLAAAWTGPLVVRRQLLPEKLKAEIEQALVASNGTAELLAQDARFVEEVSAAAWSILAALREADLLPPPARAPVTTATKP